MDLRKFFQRGLSHVVLLFRSAVTILYGSLLSFNIGRTRGRTNSGGMPGGGNQLKTKAQIN